MSVRRVPSSTWLAARLEATPPELSEAITRLLGSRATDPSPAAMVAGALDALERVAGGEQTRAAALELLAADALLTYAFERAADPADGGSAGMALELARETGPAGELGRRSVAP